MVVPSVDSSLCSMRSLGLMCLFILGCSPIQSSRACIGDTKPQLIARYGPAKEAGYQNLYSYRDMTVNVFFDKDQKSAMEVFSKRVDSQGLSEDESKDQIYANQPELTQQEIDQILKENGGNYGWGGMRSANGSDFWYRGDKKVIAQYKKHEKALVLMSVD